MNPVTISLLGSTGSIGTQTLEIAAANPEKINVKAITANRNWQLLAEQVNTIQPEYAVLRDDRFYKELKSAVKHSETKLLSGEEIENMAELEGVEVVVNALVGFAGFSSTIRALEAGKKVALANKESLVVGGPVLSQYCGIEKNLLLPVDSEHSAILQCIVGESEKEIEKLIITASGGPFREKPLEEFKQITIKDALNHPNWDMGAKITVDSATMMNKGLEIIEAHWLFNMPPEKIEAVIHPQSIIHSMVTFDDGSTKAQLGFPDMKVPIQYALSYPERWYLETPRVNWPELQQLTFQDVDYRRFPCFKLALESLAAGYHAPAILNAANEIAVERFLNQEISYISISRIVQETLEKMKNSSEVTVSSLFDSDTEARDLARSIKI